MRPLAGVALGVLCTLVVLGLIGLGVVLTGAYDVAATSGHTAFGRWALSTTMDHSVQRQAKGLTPPAPFTAADVTGGAGHYKSMCQGCHGGPGAQPEEWVKGMLPQPPDLKQAAEDMSAGEIFWILKHGIKMSGMPAIGAVHDDADLWKITAFVKALPKTSAAAYAAYPSGEEGEGDHHHDSGEHPAHQHGGHQP